MRCTGYILQYECGRDNLSNLGTRGGADHHIIVPTLYFSWIGFVEGTWTGDTCIPKSEFLEKDFHLRV